MKSLRLFLLALLPVFAAAQTVQFKSSNVAISGGTVQGITTLGARSSGAAFDLQIGSSEVLTANRLLKFNVVDAARTVTVPGTTTMPIVSQTLTISGPTAARTITVPDAAFTVARTDAANTFTGVQTIQATPSSQGDLSYVALFENTGTAYNASPAVGFIGRLIYTSGGAAMNAGGVQVLKENTTDANTSSALTFHTRSGGTVAEKVRVSSAGNLMVASTTDDGSNKIQVTGNVKVTGAMNATTAYSVNSVLLASATAPSVTGFGSSPSVPNNNGTSAFTINVGTGGTANTGSVTLPAAATGWVCTAQDVTTPASFVTAQTGGTTTTATFANYSRTTGLLTAWTASDVLRVSCFAY